MATRWDDEDWDLELLDNIIQKAEEENKSKKSAAKRAVDQSQAVERIATENLPAISYSGVSELISNNNQRPRISLSSRQTNGSNTQTTSASRPSGFSLVNDLSGYILQEGSHSGPTPQKSDHQGHFQFPDSRLSHESNDRNLNVSGPKTAPNSLPIISESPDHYPPVLGPSNLAANVLSHSTNGPLNAKQQQYAPPASVMKGIQNSGSMRIDRINSSSYFLEDNVAALKNESEKLKKNLSEKEGALSILRSRLSQAENQLFELRKQNQHNPPSVIQNQQTNELQKELGKMQSSLSFKEGELAEMRRKFMEKEEKLQQTVQQVNNLQEQLQILLEEKKAICTDDSETERMAEESAPPSGLNHSKRASEWAPPFPVDEDSNGHLQSQKRQKTDPPRVAEHPEKSISEQEDAPVPEEMDQAPKEGALPAEGHGQDPPKEPQAESSSDSIERQREALAFRAAMDNIWGPNFQQKEGSSLVSCLYSTCSDQLRCLFSAGAERPNNSGKPAEGPEILGLAERELSVQLLPCLTSVMQGSESPLAILELLLILCLSQTASVAESSAFALRKLLQYSPTSRNFLLGKSFLDPHQAVKAVCFTLNGFGWQQEIESRDLPHSHHSGGHSCSDKCSTLSAALLAFKSPRIVCLEKGDSLQELEAETIKKLAEIKLRESGNGSAGKEGASEGQMSSNSGMPVAENGWKRAEGGGNEAGLNNVGESEMEASESNSEREGSQKVLEGAEKEREKFMFTKQRKELSASEKFSLVVTVLQRCSPAAQTEVLKAMDFLLGSSHEASERTGFVEILRGRVLESLLDPRKEVSVVLPALKLLSSMLKFPDILDEFELASILAKDSEPREIWGSEILLRLRCCLAHKGSTKEDYEARLLTVQIILECCLPSKPCLAALMAERQTHPRAEESAEDSSREIQKQSRSGSHGQDRASPLSVDSRGSFLVASAWQAVPRRPNLVDSVFELLENELDDASKLSPLEKKEFVQERFKLHCDVIVLLQQLCGHSEYFVSVQRVFKASRLAFRCCFQLAHFSLQALGLMEQRRRAAGQDADLQQLTEYVQEFQGLLQLWHSKMHPNT